MTVTVVTDTQFIGFLKNKTPTKLCNYIMSLFCILCYQCASYKTMVLHLKVKTQLKKMHP